MSTKETVKKAKAPAKPRAAAKKKTAVVDAEVLAAPVATAHAPVERKMAQPSHEEIAALARQYWQERGWQDGYAEQDWLRAERELKAS